MRKKKELEELIEEMQDEADTMAFEEHAFMKEELEKHPEESYKFNLHQQQFDNTKEKINVGNRNTCRDRSSGKTEGRPDKRRERRIP